MLICKHSFVLTIYKLPIKVLIVCDLNYLLVWECHKFISLYYGGFMNMIFKLGQLR